MIQLPLIKGMRLKIKTKYSESVYTVDYQIGDCTGGVMGRTYVGYCYSVIGKRGGKYLIGYTKNPKDNYWVISNINGGTITVLHIETLS